MSDTSAFSLDVQQTLRTLLPHLDQAYENKLLRVLKDPTSVKQFQAAANLLQKNLSSISSQKDTLVAQVLLDEISLGAAQQRARIYNNALSILHLNKMLKLPSSAIRQLGTVFASFSSRLYFDAELKKSLQRIQADASPQLAQLHQAVQLLLEKAQDRLTSCREIIQKNKYYIFHIANTYHLSVTQTHALLSLYTQPASVAFHPEFERILNTLLSKNSHPSLCASLTAHTLLYELTAIDAQKIAYLQHLLNRDLLEKDLLTISCRYLRKKTPQDIFNTFETVLKKLPHLSNPDENMELAVNVLLAGTPESFQAAYQTASVARNEKMLFHQLLQDPLFSGYEHTLSRQYASKQDFQQLKKSMEKILADLPVQNSAEKNRDLACQLLLKSVNSPSTKRA